MCLPSGTALVCWVRPLFLGSCFGLVFGCSFPLVCLVKWFVGLVYGALSRRSSASCAFGRRVGLGGASFVWLVWILPEVLPSGYFLCLPIWMGSIPWRYSHSSKILFDDLSENIIYYRGISPGKPALLPTGTSVSSPGRFDWSDGGVHLPANLGTIVREPEEVECLPSTLGILVQGLGGSPSPPPGIFPGCLKIFYLDFGGFFLSLFFSRDAIISPLLARLLSPISAS